MSYGQEVTCGFGVSDNYASTYVVDKATYNYSCVIVNLSYKFASSSELIMYEVIEWLILVGSADTISYEYYSQATQATPRVL